MAYSNLSVGSSGNDVKKLQNALISAGYSVGSSGADGIYGSNTAAAVKKYQAANGLSVDGIAGNNTLSKLYGSGSTGTTTGKTNSSLSGVSSNTQSNLNQYSKGYTQSDAVTAAEKYLSEIQKQKPGEYKSAFTQQLNEMYDKIMNREAFQYDLGSDELYQQYRDQYTRLGQQAMMDTMGQAAGLTGGYGSSYSQSAGQQAYQNYLQQLNDIVPELYSQAYNRYQDEGEALYDKYALTQSADESDYGRYRDTVSDWQQAYQDAYNKFSDERSFDYDKFADMLSYWQEQAQQENSDYWTKTQFNYQKEQDALDRAAAAASSSSGSSGSSSSSSGTNTGAAVTYTSKYGGDVSTETGAMNDSAFNGYMSSLVATAKAGNVQAVANRVEAIKDSLSSEQKKTLKTTLQNLGVSVSF